MTVEVGDVAPDFELRDQHNALVRLSSFGHDKNVVVVFYPLAFTRVCGAELCGIRDDLPSFQSDTVQTLAISCDSVFSHRVWAEQEGFEFPMLADFWPHGDVAQRYGVFDDQSGLALRGTFVVDRAGVVRYKVVNAIPDARDQAEVVKALADL